MVIKIKKKFFKMDLFDHRLKDDLHDYELLKELIIVLKVIQYKEINEILFKLLKRKIYFLKILNN